MKKKFDFRILIIIVLTIVFIVMCCFYLKNDDIELSKDRQFNSSGTNVNTEANSNNKISATGEVTSGKTEKLELHATYYLEECYIQTDQLIRAGENILKYTNGSFLTAPYDCVINEINIPSQQGKCTNANFIQVSSNNVLKIQFTVDETKIDSVSLGQSASVKIAAYEDKVFDGVVTNISNTASNGKFTVTVEFENDGDVMIGMTASVTVVTE